MGDIDERLPLIGERVEAATPGPWELVDFNEGENPPRGIRCIRIAGHLGDHHHPRLGWPRAEPAAAREGA